MERVCVIGAGAIGSLFAGHLAAVADVSILTRRPEQAAALEREGLHISGRSERQATVRASADPDALPPFDLGIVATKAGGLEAATASLRGRFPDATIMTVLNGLGAEEAVRDAGSWPIISGVTFMSGTRHSDTHVEYVLDTETWLGPYEETPFAVVSEAADLMTRRGAARRGASRPAPGAVVEADLQRHRERGRGADRSPPRLRTSRPRSGRATSAISSTTSSTRARPSPRRPGSSCTTTRGR